jgi:CRP-like cAMP-binding protein/Flp pilus assembly protein TadD
MAESPLKASSSRKVKVEDYCELASKFVTQNRFDDAIEIYERAARLYPDSIALRINLGRVKSMKRKAEDESAKMLESQYAAHRQAKDKLATHFNALGEIFIAKGDTQRAAELFELARVNNPNFYLPLLNLGRHFYRVDDWEPAREHLARALELNPLSGEVNYLLGRCYFYLKDFDMALPILVDALILIGSQDPQVTRDLQDKIRLTMDRGGAKNKGERNELIRARTARLNQLVKELDSKRKELVDHASVVSVKELLLKTRVEDREKRDLLQLALRMKQFALMKGFDDELLFKIAKTVKIIECAPDEVIFPEEDASDTFYLVEQGTVRIGKDTPFGEQRLATIKEGEFFGEMNFIDPAARSAKAVANESGRFIALSREALLPIIEQHKEIAVQFYWHFWRSLAQRTRDANEMLKTFFTDAEKAQLAPSDVQRVQEAKAISVDLDQKLKLLQEQGLSSRELRLLATFSNEELYDRDEIVFKEGDKGDKLYIVLGGKVRISKHIPGVGEEALAILDRGDFFGEMALIDDSAVRAADALAHTDGTTVLSITRDVLREIISVDVESAYQFLSILCRILTTRLREINLKIVQWRLMSGGF